jgi:hypothetical protein
MAPDPVLHERIYAALKLDLREGRLLPGQHIDLQGISDHHRASITPVREAVCRLVGERLVESQRHGGFRVVHLGADTLRELYMLNLAMVLHAVRISTDENIDRAIGTFWYPATSADPSEIAAAAASLFASLGGASGLAEFQIAVEGINDRLASARIMEVQALRDLRRELLMINHGPNGDIRRTIARRISTYHRRRIAVVGKIAHLLLAGSV